MPSFRYQALGPLPSAGGSSAFLGLVILDESRAEPVVLVWVPEDVAQDIEKSERIQRETERAALLEHPHIVRVYGFARMDGARLARVVEFADGENLRRVLETVGPLPAPLAARLIADAAQGVHYAHLAGNDDGTPLLHGDLRPETLLVAFKGQCRVAGYGAAAFAPKNNHARNIRVAPEQVLGGRGAMNVQTDVYLLGATLFECLTGKAPFEEAEDVEQAVLSQPLDLSKYEEIPDSLKPVISQALAKKAADRYPSAMLLREAIELALQPLPDASEVGHWLTERFPDADGTRAERQSVIDRGIAAFARAQWAKQADEPSARPAFPSVAPVPEAPSPAVAQVVPDAAAGPAPAPESPAPAASTPAEEVPAPTSTERPPPASSAAVESAAQAEQPAPTTQRRSSAMPIFVVLAVLALAAGAWFWLQRGNESAPQNASAEAPPSTPVVAVAEALDAGAVPDDAGTVAAATNEVPDAGPGVVPVLGTLSLTVEPAVAVEIDGAAPRKTPLKIALAPGRHRLRLIDRAQGVDLTRSVVVADKGITTQEVYLQRGAVSVNAPPGAEIAIDGKTVGRAPLKTDVSVYEGGHSVEVTMGGSHWRDTFTVKPGQRVYFDVGPQYR